MFLYSCLSCFSLKQKTKLVRGEDGMFRRVAVLDDDDDDDDDGDSADNNSNDDDSDEVCDNQGIC